MAGKIEEPGLDPEGIFNEGVQYQRQQDDTELREQIAEQLVSQGGFNPDEVEQLLFSGDTDIYKPKRRGHRGHRGGKRRCSAKQWAKMPQICRGTGGARVRTARHPVMVYDPAPRGGYRAAARRYYHKKGGAKGLVAGLKPLVLPGAALATVYTKYTERAVALKAAGAQIGAPPHLVDGVIDAIRYDLENRPKTSVMDRIKANAVDIVVPMLAGGAYKGYIKGTVKKLHPKVNQIADLGAEAAIGMGIGSLINAILDPPGVPNQIQAQQPAQMQPAQKPAAPAMTYSGNPTGGF